tara:strand:+ start:319 stop:747 length:429 start_codon:yes stop_codon:yes gene_type:complete
MNFPIFALLKLIRKIVSLFLVGIILSFSGGLHVAKHLCNGDVVARAINHEVELCKKAREAKAAPSCDLESVSSKSCCDTEIEFFHTDSFSKVFSLFTIPLAQPFQWQPQQIFSPSESTFTNLREFQNLKGPPLFMLIEHYLI